MSELDLSIVIVNYNSGRWLHDCLHAIGLRQPTRTHEVIVVDNASRDGSANRLSADFPDVKLIRNPTNAGFGDGANLGIQAAQGRYVLIMNPDVIWLNQGMDHWLDAMDEHSDVGISGPKVYDDESRRSLQLSARSFPTFANYLFSRHSPLTRLFPNNPHSRRFLMSERDPDEPRDVDWVSGCCMLLRREMLDEVGDFDGRYPLFFEDVDLCRRARNAGWRVRYCPQLEVAHHTGTLRAQAPYRTLGRRHRSLWRYYRKFHAKSWLLDGLIGVGIGARFLFLCVLEGLKRVGPLLIDIALIQGAAILAYAVRGIWIFPWFERAVDSYLAVAPGYTLLQLVFLFAYGLYERASRYRDYLDVLPRVVKAVSLGSLMLVVIAYFGRVFVLPRSIVLLTWLFNLVLLTGWRMIALWVQHRRQPAKRVLIYGTGPLASTVDEELRRRPALRVHPVGFVASGRGTGDATIVEPIHGELNDLPALVERLKVDEVIFAPENRSDEEMHAVARQASSAHVNTRVAPELFEIAMGIAHAEHAAMPLLDPADLPGHRSYLRIKRVLDVGVSGLLLALTAPLQGLIALGVRASSPGSIFFRQQRVGQGGEEFTLSKFRTMADPPDGEFAEEDVSRMTPFGRFLRLTRLDELPQLWNVLKGEMSLVGPRAEWVPIARQMERELPFFEQRYAVRPGMTGWAQVEYKYTTSLEEYRVKLQYDLYYVKHLSFAFDLQILFKTLWIVLTGRGAR